MQHVRAAAPVAPWRGGKKTLAARIIERIEAIPHKTYVEPFVGMGGVFLRRRLKPTCEVANDLNGEIVNLFRVLQRHLPFLLDHMRFQITSRRAFENLRNTPPDGLTDIERAARFLYLQRLAFGGQVAGVFGVSPGNRPRFSVSRIEPILEAAHERLDGVIFECLPWLEVFARYDTPETLVYLDPPYAGGEADYGKDMFAWSDFELMAQTMRAMAGQAILSINDTPEIREVFDGFHMEEMRLTYSISKGEGTIAKELLISTSRDASRLL
ncbi:MAG: DNA adenine methylase [Pseudomonadota bacterium]